MWEPKYVTVISGESPDYTVDGLADGFMRWLGKERVRVNLWLGPASTTDEFEQLRPVYAWNYAPLPWPASESELLVLSTRGSDRAQEMVNAGMFRCPVASIDSRDFPLHEVHMAEVKGLTSIPFKREVSYTFEMPTTYPCPTGLIPDNVLFLKPYQKRSISVAFIAGKSNMTREAIAEVVNCIPGSFVRFDQRIPRAEYLAVLQDAKIGVSCYGAGFESYRYWEIPQAGCLLVAQPPPLLIPHNFQFQRHAVFYLSHIDLMAALQWALSHEQEASQIAQAGTAHLHQYHTTVQRAQWVAECVAQHLKSPNTWTMPF